MIGLITWGEGFHNTHHSRPGRANFSDTTWEIDTTFLFARLLEKFNLVKVR
jgi:stearoyl-CoA desaturase (delta-9 desaturase)